MYLLEDERENQLRDAVKSIVKESSNVVTTEKLSKLDKVQTGKGKSEATLLHTFCSFCLPLLLSKYESYEKGLKRCSILTSIIILLQSLNSRSIND